MVQTLVHDELGHHEGCWMAADFNAFQTPACLERILASRLTLDPIAIPLQLLNWELEYQSPCTCIVFPP